MNWGQIFAIAAAILISFLNYLGVKKAGEFQLVFTLLKVAIILGIVVVCFSGMGDATGRGWSNFAGTFAGAKGGIAGFMAALVAALWAYDGWNDLNMVAGEVKRPERNIPIALIAGVATVGVLYVLVNAAVQYVLPASAIAASPRPASDAVALVMGRMGASIVSAGMALSMLVTLNGTIMSGARVPFAVARDGYFFRALAEVHPQVSHAFGGDRRAGRAVDSALAAGSKFPAAVFSGDFCGVALLHDRGQHNLYLPAARSAGSASLSHVGLSDRARGFRRGCRGAFLLHFQERLAEFWLSECSSSWPGFRCFYISPDVENLSPKARASSKSVSTLRNSRLGLPNFLHQGSYPFDSGFPPCFFPVSSGQKARRHRRKCLSHARFGPILQRARHRLPKVKSRGHVYPLSYLPYF